MRVNAGGVLNISYSDPDKINKEKLVAAFKHINWTPDGVDAILESMLGGNENFTGFTFTGTTASLEKFLFAVEGSGVEIEVLREPPTPELARMLEKFQTED
jgi:hypothetical protein